jgi:hypothetical protein
MFKCSQAKKRRIEGFHNMSNVECLDLKEERTKEYSTTQASLKCVFH